LIRNWISVALLLLFILYATFPVIPLDIIDHVIWAVALFALLLIGFVFGKVGGGDVKLATVVMLWIGPKAGPEFFVITALCGGILALFIVMPILSLMREWAIAPFIKTGMVSEEGASPTVPYGVAIAAGGTVALYKTYLNGIG
jgi:prepilin peptidase CpaA